METIYDFNADSRYPDSGLAGKKVKKEEKRREETEQTKEGTSKLKPRLARRRRAATRRRGEGQKRRTAGRRRGARGSEVRAPRRYVREERTKRDNGPVDIINQEEVRKGKVGGEGERRAEEETWEGKGGWQGGAEARGQGKHGRTSPAVFTTYHRKSMIARTARFNEIPFPFLYVLPLPSDHSSASCTRADVRICPAIHRFGRWMLKPKNL